MAAWNTFHIQIRNGVGVRTRQPSVQRQSSKQEEGEKVILRVASSGNA